MLEPKDDAPSCELGGVGGDHGGVCLHMPPRSSEGEESSLYPSSPSEPPTLGSPHTSEPLTPLDEVYMPLGGLMGSGDRHKVPPTPPPSTEGEDWRSMEGNEMEIWRERSDSKRRSMVEGATCEKHGGGRLSVQNSLRRRTHSEGSLLQDPRTPCFTSDNAINCLEAGGAHHKGGWTLPSPKTLKKELTKSGGSMHQLCMLFSGRK
ncbi:hypothetical protein JOQ06_008387, partial [Pogonophryne albipinna]